MLSRDREKGEAARKTNLKVPFPSSIFSFKRGNPVAGAKPLPIPGIVTYVEGVSGKFFNNKAVAIQSSKASYDESAAKRLWEIRAELTHLDTPAL